MNKRTAGIHFCKDILFEEPYWTIQNVNYGGSGADDGGGDSPLFLCVYEHSSVVMM